MTEVVLTPFQAIVSGLVVVLLFAVLIGSIVSWSYWFSGKRPAIIARQPLATVGLVDLLVAFALMITLYAFAMLLWRMSTTALPAAQISVETTESAGAAPNQLTETKFIFSGCAMTTQLLCVLLVTFFVKSRSGCSNAMLGWRLDHIRSDLLAGFQYFLMLTPVELLLNAILIQWTDVPYEHPIQQMLERYPWLLGIAFWQACVVAPISEEFAFRSLLIGWFESLHFGKDKLAAFLVGHNPELNSTVDNADSDVDLFAALRDEDTQDAFRERMAMRPGSDDMHNPYSPPQRPIANYAGQAIDDAVDPTLPLEMKSMTDSAYRPPWWPALLSGSLFGLAHFDYGVSWISLVLFGIVLGRLYQIRQSLVPVILVHVLFNGLSMLMMAAKLLLPDT